MDFLLKSGPAHFFQNFFRQQVEEDFIRLQKISTILRGSPSKLSGYREAINNELVSIAQKELKGLELNMSFDGVKANINYLLRNFNTIQYDFSFIEPFPEYLEKAWKSTYTDKGAIKNCSDLSLSKAKLGQTTRIFNEFPDPKGIKLIAGELQSILNAKEYSKISDMPDENLNEKEQLNSDLQPFHEKVFSMACNAFLDPLTGKFKPEVDAALSEKYPDYYQSLKQKDGEAITGNIVYSYILNVLQGNASAHIFPPNMPPPPNAPPMSVFMVYQNSINPFLYGNDPKTEKKFLAQKIENWVQGNLAKDLGKKALRRDLVMRKINPL